MTMTIGYYLKLASVHREPSFLFAQKRSLIFFSARDYNCSVEDFHCELTVTEIEVRHLIVYSKIVRVVYAVCQTVRMAD